MSHTLSMKIDLMDANFTIANKAQSELLYIVNTCNIIIFLLFMHIIYI